MWRIEGICVSVTRGLQGRQRQEFELRLSYSSGRTNLGVTDARTESGGASRAIASVPFNLAEVSPS